MTLLQEIENLTWFNEVNKLKSILKKLLGQSEPKYKVYSALVTQEGTNTPTAMVLENTLGDITFSYNNVGEYTINSNNLFLEDKTFLTVGNSRNIGGFITEGGGDSSPSNIYILTTSTDNEPANDIFNLSIEIRVYN